MQVSLPVFTLFGSVSAFAAVCASALVPPAAAAALARGIFFFFTSQLLI